MALLLAALLGIYSPRDWRSYPSMDQIRCISTSPTQLFVAVPKGVYVLDHNDYAYLRCLTEADGIRDDVNLCAYNPSRAALLVSASGHLYEYITATDLVAPLAPPFEEIRSIGIARDGAYFDTEKGLFKKHRTADLYTEIQSAPAAVTWYGQRDSSRPEDYVFLTPYFVTDEQLATYPLTLVRRDRKLYVAAAGYGLLVYNSRLGIREAHVRLGPSGDARRVTRLDNRLWFLGNERMTVLDSAGGWQYFLTRPGDIALSGFRLLFGNVAQLDRNERMNAFLADSGRLYIGTGRGLYVMGPDSRLTELLRTNRHINALLKLRDSILVGADEGLFLLEGDSLSSVVDPYGRVDWGVYDIARTRSGSTFFGTLGGIVSLDSAGTWQQYVPPGFDLSRPVRALAATDSLVFFGSATGISVLNTRNGSYTTIDQTNGLYAKDIIGLWADKGFLWITSPGIVYRFDYTRTLR